MKQIKDFTRNKISLQNQNLIIGSNLIETFMRDDMRDWWDDKNGNGKFDPGETVCFEVC